jgi:hypothetical protein
MNDMKTKENYSNAVIRAANNAVGLIDYGRGDAIRILTEYYKHEKQDAIDGMNKVLRDFNRL